MCDMAPLARPVPPAPQTLTTSEEYAMRVLLSDMPPALRAQIRLLLQREPWVTAVSADSPEPAFDDPGGGYEPLDTLTRAPASTSDLTGQVGAAGADLVLLDWDTAAPLPQGALESLRASHPSTQVAALSARPDERAAALAAGVDLFLPTDGTPEDAVATLRRALGAG
jgi:DNA-binding NarL/FixJ family response regulator